MAALPPLATAEIRAAQFHGCPATPTVRDLVILCLYESHMSLYLTLAVNDFAGHGISWLPCLLAPRGRTQSLNCMAALPPGRDPAVPMRRTSKQASSSNTRASMQTSSSNTLG